MGQIVSTWTPVCFSVPPAFPCGNVMCYSKLSISLSDSTVCTARSEGLPSYSHIVGSSIM